MKNKLQIRAQILNNLKSAQDKIEKRVLDYNDAIKFFQKIEDKTILVKIILKEFQGNGSDFDSFLTMILTQAAPKEAESSMFEMIMSDDISDIKKIYFINILKEINQNADYNALVESIKNPDETISMETKKFAQDSIFSTSQQIDFMDFYFASNLDDKKELVENLIENSNGDEVAHILSLILYSNDEESEDFIIDKLGKTHSYLAFYPLEHVVDNFKDKKLINSAKKGINELKISGLRKKIKKSELYKEILFDSKPLNAWITNVDGASNYVLMFSREKENSCISFFSVIINLKYGVIECFGFEDLERFEFREIAKKIFKEDKVYQISKDDAIILLDDADHMSIKSSHTPPYEYFAWRALTYDVETKEKFDEKIKKILCKKDNITKNDIDKIKNNSFFNSWFLKNNDSIIFENTLKKINLSKKMEDVNGIITKNVDKIFDKIFDKTLLYQSYILHLANQEELSKILYSLIDENKEKEELKKYILKKSILFYYNEQEENVFAKNINKKIAQEIKKQWEKEF